MTWTGLSALVVPLGGLAVQPVLAQALGAAGRGEFAAAMAPAILATSVATLGLPETLTYYVARDPRVLRRALAVAVVLSLALGVLCLGGVYLAAPLLAGGDDELARLVVLAMVCSLPLLVVGAVRGAAIGHQLYRFTAAESLINALARVVAFTALWLTDSLTAWSAVLVTCATQVLAALVYVRPLSRPLDGASPWTLTQAVRPLLSYGSRIWFGAVASMMLARTAQVVMVPLSSTRELGLYSVVVTISDLPVLVAFAIARAVGGVNAREGDWTRVARSARVTGLMAALGCGALAASLPLWLTPLFGEEFADALWPTVLGLAAASIAAPAYVLTAGVSSSGRPGLRSLAYVVAFATNTSAFVAFVPTQGALGAAIASVITGVVLTAVVTFTSVRLSGLSVRTFLVPTTADLGRLVGALSGMAARAPVVGPATSRRLLRQKGRHRG